MTPAELGSRGRWGSSPGAPRWHARGEHPKWAAAGGRETFRSEHRRMETALLRSDPFGDVARLLRQLWAQHGSGSAAMPTDAFGEDDAFFDELDLSARRR